MTASKLRSRNKLGTKAVADATAELLQRFRWDLIVTLTTRKPCGPESLMKRYRTLVRRVESDRRGLGLKGCPLYSSPERLRHAVAWERQKRGVWHLHALWGAPGARGIRRGWVKKTWNELCRPNSFITDEEVEGVAFLVTSDSKPRGKRPHSLEGIADVALIRDKTAVAKYCSKYVVKGGAVELFGLRADA